MTNTIVKTTKNAITRTTTNALVKTTNNATTETIMPVTIAREKCKVELRIKI